MSKAEILAQNYPHLQNLIKRDPESYQQEFLLQYQHFKSLLSIIQLSPASSDSHFESLATFISHVASLYPESKKEFPGLLVDLISKDAGSLTPSLRKCLVQCILLLRKQNLFETLPLLELFFRLLRIQDKALRLFLEESIVAEVRRANHPHKNNSLNRSLQNFMYQLLEEGQKSDGLSEEDGLATHKILSIIIELYKKKIWEDSRTVNVVAEAATRKVNSKVMTTALNFFIGRFRGSSIKEDEEKPNNSVSFSAIHLLNDPQGFVEKLFNHLKRSIDSFETKLLLMNVISRVIGAHRLILLDFYSFLLRYIQPHQKEVTHILAYAAQSTHDLVPTDVLEPLVRSIAHNFVAEHCANEVIAAGLNGIREICSRCPTALGEELLQDLATFKGYHDKGVVMATRSLIGLYREVNPQLLHRRDRGKEMSLALKEGKVSNPRQFTPQLGPHLDASKILKEELESKVDLDSDDDSEATDSSSEGPDIITLASQKLLEPHEFSRLRKRMAGKLDESSSDDEGSNTDESSSNSDHEIVDPQSLESSKKKKADYQARLASIHAGRGDRQFGSKRGKHNENSSKTNRIKEKKTKNAIMLVHKREVRAKKRRSLREKQESLLKHRKNQKLRK